MKYDITIRTETAIHQYRKSSRTSSGAILKAFDDAREDGVNIIGAAVSCREAQVEKIKAKNVDMDFIEELLNDPQAGDQTSQSLLTARYAHGFHDDVPQQLQDVVINYIDSYGKDRLSQDYALEIVRKIFEINE